MTTKAQRDYSQTGDIDRLLEEILLPSSNHRRSPDREEPVVYARVYKRTGPDAVGVKTPAEADENGTAVTGQRSFRAGQLRAATLQASSVTPSMWQELSKQQKQEQPASRVAVEALASESCDAGLMEAAKATSCLWYRPTLSRDEVSRILKSQPVGSFLVRRSASHPGCCDLAIRVSQGPPPTVRHFLVERCATGVRIRGGGSQASEFASLAALVTAGASATGHPTFPCRLRLPAPLSASTMPPSQQPSMTTAGRIVRQPECAALYLAAVDVETATGAAAVARATDALMRSRHRSKPRPCRLVATPDGGFRICGLDEDGRSGGGEKCIPAACILHCGYDPSMRSYDTDKSLATGSVRPKIFGFVLRKRADTAENTAILACDSGDPQGADTLVKYLRRCLGL